MRNHRQYEKPIQSTDRRSAFVQISGRIREMTVYGFGIPPTIHPAICLPSHSDCLSWCSRIQFIHDCFARTHTHTHTRAGAHTRTHTYTYTRTHAHAHTHTHWWNIIFSISQNGKAQHERGGRTGRTRLVPCLTKLTLPHFLLLTKRLPVSQTGYVTVTDVNMKIENLIRSTLTVNKTN